jgi:four helix bundle protein
MDSQDLRKRTKQFAVRVVRLSASLPANRVGDVLGRQILKSGTSVGANYREALRASSKRHFISTLEISAREADETLYWLKIQNHKS